MTDIFTLICAIGGTIVVFACGYVLGHGNAIKDWIGKKSKERRDD